MIFEGKFIKCVKRGNEEGLRMGEVVGGVDCIGKSVLIGDTGGF